MAANADHPGSPLQVHSDYPALRVNYTREIDRRRFSYVLLTWMPSPQGVLLSLAVTVLCHGGCSFARMRLLAFGSPNVRDPSLSRKESFVPTHCRNESVSEWYVAGVHVTFTYSVSLYLYLKRDNAHLNSTTLPHYILYYVAVS